MAEPLGLPALGPQRSELKGLYRQLNAVLECDVVGHSFRLVSFLFIKGGSACHRRAGATWRQEHKARPVLADPAISNVDRDAKAMGEIAGGTS
jgi:hypothetical protein